MFLYQTDLLENTPGDPDPNEDEGVFLDWVDARHPKTIDFKIIRIRNRFERCIFRNDYVILKHYVILKLLRNTKKYNVMHKPLRND